MATTVTRVTHSCALLDFDGRALAHQPAEYCAVLKPKVAGPIRYAFTAGPMRDRLFLKYDGTPELFERAVARHAPATQVRVLAPGESLTFED